MHRSLTGSIAKSMLCKVLEAFGNPPVRVVLWDGQVISVSHRPPIATLSIRDPVTLLKFVRNPEIHFGDAYASGQITIDGDLSGLLDILFEPNDRWLQQPTALWRTLATRLRGRRGSTLRRSRHNVHHHYDLGNDFYKLWLDHQLVYTCAYYPSLRDTLEDAQVAKMHHVCRKLQLRPGETVVEAGCGWGALALHMARYYGVSVKAYNVSREQILFARQRAEREGLQGRVEFIEGDYRKISGQFDAFVSVGMLEHVGPEYYAEFGRVIDHCLTRNGRALLHFIGRNQPRPINGWIQKRIFPGSHIPTIREVMQVFEPVNLSILDVENLRLHYAKTLEHWLERFEKSADLVEGMYNAQFVRAWRLYLAASVASFRMGWLQLFQVLVAPSFNNRISWTRAHVYAAAGDEMDRHVTAASSANR